MGWFASHVYVEPTESVISILSSHRVLSKGMFWILDLEGHTWDNMNLAHSLPKGGLYVVREVCNPDLGNAYPPPSEAKWHIGKGNNVLSWNSVVGPEMLEILMPDSLPMLAFGSRDDEQVARYRPPLAFLRYLKDLSQTTGTTVCYYHHKDGANWDVLQEFAWVFGKDECVYVRHDWKSILKYTLAGQEEASTNDETVAMLVLSHLGVNLQNSYFALHDRHFSWRKYDVSLR